MIQYLFTKLTIFGLMALASKEIGRFLTRLGLPLISGFLIVGIISGPYVLGVFDERSRQVLHFIDAFALAFIALAAGSELHLSELRGNWRSIASLIAGQTIAVYFFGILAFLLLAERVPFMQGLNRLEVIAVAILGATIMVARSPASAYAIIKELRARGPFTQRVLGATVLKDGVVILLFAASVSIASALLDGTGVDLVFLTIILIEIVLDILIGIAFALAWRLVLAIRLSMPLKGALLLLSGYGIFWLSEQLHAVEFAGLTLFSEPLLICMMAGFYLSNFTPHRAEFHEIVENLAPYVFIVFFTLVGIEMNLDVLQGALLVLFVLWLARLLGIFVGSFAGGMAAGNPLRQNAVIGLTFITQAGVSVGLAQEVGVEFSPWGADFATLAIAVIVLNQIVGPPFFKWAIRLVGEAHPHSQPPEFDGVRDVLIFGVGLRERALTRRLSEHGWNVKLVCLQEHLRPDTPPDPNIDIQVIENLSLSVLHEIGAPQADAVVAMLPDDDLNYRITEMIYEHIGTENMVVYLRDAAKAARFRELGVSVVEPTTAVVSLLEHFVRAPTSTSLLLGQDSEQEVVEWVVRSPDLDGVAIRDLHLPADILILSLNRQGENLISHGYTRLRVGDHVTALGSPQSLEALELRFEGLHLPDRLGLPDL